MTDQIKVLMQNRSDMFIAPGGDTIQLLNTKKYLEKLGLQVDVSCEYKLNLNKYDVVHLFQLTISPEETLVRFKNAQNQHKPVVLSPIYWDDREFIRNGLMGLKRKLYYMLPEGKLREFASILYNKDITKLTSRESYSNFYINITNRQVKLLNECDAILPNSKMEIDILKKKFPIHEKQVFYVIPNAIDRLYANANPDLFLSSYGFSDFVLCVGRIEDRKNQLSLIKALNHTNINLVLIGGANKRKISASYFDLCKKEAGNNVVFIDWIEGELLASAYAAAKVHALVSWYETPGLSSLEAGLAGCNIVTTDRGSTREYFTKFAWYCDPSNIESIKNAVLYAYHAKKESTLKQYLLENFTWEKTAEKTLNAYYSVLNKVDKSYAR